MKRKLIMDSIFISHNSKDKRFVRKLARDLKRFGVYAWVDEAEVKAGDSLIRKVTEGIKGAKYLAVVLSPNSVNSPWVQKELEIAINREIESRGIKILPLLLKECEIPEFLRDKLYVNFQKAHLYTKGLKLILDSLEVVPSGEWFQVSYQDAMDEVEYRRLFDGSATIKDIRKASPRDTSLWVRIVVDRILRLKDIELFLYDKDSIKKREVLNITYEFNIDDLMIEPVNVPDSKDEEAWERFWKKEEEEWKSIIRILERELWERSSVVMHSFDSKEISIEWADGKNPTITEATINLGEGKSVIWGDLDKKAIPSSLKILFYLEDFSYLWVCDENEVRVHDPRTLQELVERAEKLSIIFEDVVGKVKAEFDRLYRGNT